MTAEAFSRAPLEPGERIASLDIVRGLALFGVLVANLASSFRASVFQHFTASYAQAPALDRAAEAFIRLAIEGKAMSLFALLFGVGLAIQHERFSRAGPAAYWLARRLLALFAFGLLHLLFVWNGDILAEHAVAGLLLLPLLGAPPRSLGRWAAGLLALSLALLFAPLPLPWLDPAWTEREIASAARAYGAGSYAEVRAYSLRELAALLPMRLAFFPQTLALLLLGVLAWRRGWLRDPRAHRATLARLAAVGLIAGALLTGIDREDSSGWSAEAYLLIVVAAGFAPLVLATGYGAAALLALEASAVRRALAPLAPLGRMAFTNYIAQSILFGLLFYGYGLGWFNRMGIAPAVALGVAVYALQAAASAAWLRRWRFGPLEWLWRTLTYGRMQPMAR